jgi:FkbM family methyltransferase
MWKSWAAFALLALASAAPPVVSGPAADATRCSGGIIADPSVFLHCIHIEGDLILRNSELANLDAFSNVASISKDGQPSTIEIAGCQQLTSLAGLSALTSPAGSIIVRDNDVLTSLHGLHNIKSAAQVVVAGNARLVTLDALSGLEGEIAQGMVVVNNAALKSLKGLRVFTDSGATAQGMLHLRNRLIHTSDSSHTGSGTEENPNIKTASTDFTQNSFRRRLVAKAFGRKQGLSILIADVAPVYGELGELRQTRAEIARLQNQVLKLEAGAGFNKAPAGYETTGILSDKTPFDFRSFAGTFPHGGPAVRVSFGQVGTVHWWPTVLHAPATGWDPEVVAAFAAIGREVPKKPTWERETFALWHQLVDSRTVYIGFGAWVGPTALFAAHRAKYVFVFEPDPFCFSDLWANFVLNPHVTTKKVALHRQCISNKREVASFLGVGASGSGMTETVTARDKSTFTASLPRWNVQCDRLMPSLSKLSPSPFQMLGAGDKLFLKIDTEGAELIILPDIFDVLLQAQQQITRTGVITVILSMHDSLKSGTPAQVERFWSALARFKTITSVPKFLAGERTPAADIAKPDFHAFSEFVLHGPVV